MSKSIIDAIINISNLEKIGFSVVTAFGNRAISMGLSLETFVKEAIAGTLGMTDELKKMHIESSVFSYAGSATRPPDLMIAGGDAIEIKKVEQVLSELQLNSSYPKRKLLSTSSLINKHCKECELWTEKDFFYVIGHVLKGKNNLSSLWFIDGSIYAADEETYLTVKDKISETLTESLPEYDFHETREIGRLNEVDPLKITNLRVRGMWLLKSPALVFNYVSDYNKDAIFQLIALMPLEKYNNFPKEDINKLENNSKISITNVSIKDPNNPVNLIDSVRIGFTI